MVLAFFAHSPVLRSGLFAWDYAEILGPPVGRTVSLVARLASSLPAPGASALPWRLEPWLVLLAIAFVARLALTRLYEPWLGVHPARAAALVGALLLPLHPAVPAATAERASLGELHGLLLALSSAALFLRGRQLQSEVATLASFGLLVLAAAVSSVALPFVIVMAGAEYLSVRRHRRRSLRLRTAAVTALAFGAGAWLATLLRAAPGSAPTEGLALPFGAELRERALGFAAELGRVASGPEAAGAAGDLAAGLLLLLASFPLFRAARHAPRLWGWISLLLGGALLGALLWGSSWPGEGRVLPAALVWSAGLGLTLSALARPLRGVLVVVVALGWAVLAHAGARPWLVGSRVLAGFHAELVSLAPARDAPVLVLDPPVVAGLPPLTRALGWLFHPRLEGAAELAFDPLRVQGLSHAAFLALTRSEAFGRLRARAPVVLAPRRALGEEQEGWRAIELAPARAGARADDGVPGKPWRGGLTYVPDEPFDPLRLEAVRLVADMQTAPRELERLGWRTASGESGSVAARPFERGGRRVAEFDLSSSIPWVLAGSVKRLLVEQGESGIERAELLARLPELPGPVAPALDGRDWCFAPPALADEERGGTLVLVLLATHELEGLELVLEPHDAHDAPGSLCARGAQGFVARTARPEAPVAWALEYRIGVRVVYRSRGVAVH